MNLVTPEIYIPLFALGISLISLIYTALVDRKRLAFEKKYYEFNALQLEKECSASFNVSQYPIGNSNRLVIKNTGKAEARNISIDIPNLEGLHILEDLSKKFPIGRLPPDGLIEIMILLDYKGSKKCEIILNWSDDYQPKRSEKCYLTW
jgi:hypothetical protein